MHTRQRLPNKYNGFLQHLPCRVPDRLFFTYNGVSQSMPPDRSVPITTTRFLPSTSHEYFCIFGSDLGCIGVMDMRHAGVSSEFFCHYDGAPEFNFSRHSINSIACVPSRRSQIVVAAYDSLTLFDFESQKTSSLVGHTGNIKQVDNHVDNPNVFASCSFGNEIFVWDLREQAFTRAFIPPVLKINNANQTNDAQPSGGYDNDKQVQSVKFLDDKTLISSGPARSGIRVWDLRYQKINTPVAVKSLHERAINLAVSKTRRHNFFAVSSGSRVYEFNGIHDSFTDYSYTIPCFRNRCATITTSPFSSHILVAGANNQAMIFDTQHGDFAQDSWTGNNHPIVKDVSDHRFELGEFLSYSGVADWSASGRYMFTASDYHCTVWDREWPSDVPFEPIDYATYVKPLIPHPLVAAYSPDEQLREIYAIKNASGVKVPFFRIQIGDEYLKKVRDPKWNLTIRRNEGHRSDFVALDSENEGTTLRRIATPKRKKGVTVTDRNILSFLSQSRP